MNNNQDEELIQLIKAVVEGKAQKKELCNKIYKEVYALSYPVFRDEEKSMTEAKKALIEVCNKVEDINLSKNVHKQIAVIVSSYFMVSAVKEHESELHAASQMNEYEYSRIREDEDLLEYMKKKARVFRSPKLYDEQKGELDSLNSVYMALLELYAYEMQSVDDIEQLTDIDSSYIAGWIADIKAAVLGYDVRTSASVAEDTDDGTAADDVDSDEDTAQDAYESDEDISDDDEESDEDEHNDEYEEKRAVSSVYNSRKQGKENAVTLFIKKLFPDLSLSARKTVSWISGCVVVIILVSVLMVSVVSARSRKKVNSSYDYKNMQQYTSGQAPTRQSATKKQRTEDETKTEEATTKTEASKEVITEATTEARAANQQNSNNSDGSEQKRPAGNSDDDSNSNNDETTSSSDDDKSGGEVNNNDETTSSSADDKNGGDSDNNEKTTPSSNDNKEDSDNNEKTTSSSDDNKGDSGNNDETTSSSDDDKNMGGGIIIR